MSCPFFSIITVCYNAGDALIKAVEDAFSQSFDDIEIIVKDGGSSDGSVERLKEAFRDPRLTVLIQPDGGIYDAMNRACELARGKYLYFLNCGDRFADENVLRDVHARLTCFSDDLKASNALDAANHEYIPFVVAYGDYIADGLRRVQPRRLTAGYLYRRPLNHQSMFFGRGVFVDCGGYDTDLKVRADHALTLKAFREGAKFVRIKRVISVYEQGGYSENAANREQRKKDIDIIRNTYFSDKEQKKYKLYEKLGMRNLRNKLADKSSPRAVRKLYARIADLFNR